MTSVEAAEAAVEKERQRAVEAQEVYLQSLAEQWRDLATQRVRRLVVEQQPTVTAGLADLGAFKAGVAAVIDAGADRAPKLFRPSSDPELLVRQTRRTTWGGGSIDINHGGYIGPFERLTKPLHDFLEGAGFNPGLMKSTSGREHSSYGFTQSDFPLPSYEVTKAYTNVIYQWGEAIQKLEQARHEEASKSVADLWDEPHAK